MSDVTQLPPTIGIQDSDTRQFADALVNLLDLRSGNTNKDSLDRFVTARDLNSSAGELFGGVGSGGASGLGSSSGSGSGAVADAIRNMSNAIHDSLLARMLETPIQLIDPPEALVQSLRQDLESQIKPLKDGITQINTITSTSSSFAAQTLFALKGTVEGPTGLPLAQAYIAQMDDVNVTSTHASVNNLRGLMSAVYDPNTGLAKARADIVELNKIDVTSTSALAQRVRSISSEVGIGAQTFIQASQPISTTSYTIRSGDMWINTSTNATYIFDGFGWQYSPLSRIGGSLSRIVAEETTRNTQTTALASAINTIWSSVGGGQALIQDGYLASISPAAAQASKWQQVQAAVTDPNTGQVNSTSIKQDMISYASKVDGTLNSIYSVRAQTTSSGRTVVGGFGLSATSGAGSAAGPSIDFGVNADTFWVGGTSGVGDYPFIVRTSGSNPGTYIKSAFIENASITSAKIGDLQIDTLKVAQGAVTTTNYADGADRTLGPSSFPYTATLCSTVVNMPAGSSGVVISAFTKLYGVNADCTAWLTIKRNGVPLKFIGVSCRNGFQSCYSIVAFDPSPDVGYNTYELFGEVPTSGPGSNLPFGVVSPSITATGGKR